MYTGINWTSTCWFWILFAGFPLRLAPGYLASLLDSFILLMGCIRSLSSSDAMMKLSLTAFLNPISCCCRYRPVIARVDEFCARAWIIFLLLSYFSSCFCRCWDIKPRSRFKMWNHMTTYNIFEVLNCIRADILPLLMHMLYKIFTKPFPAHRKSTGWDHSDKSGSFTFRCTPFNTVEIILLAGEGSRYVVFDPFGRSISRFKTGVVDVIIILLRKSLALSKHWPF